ncbi:MAG: tail fiber domain-containing protein [Chthoniobacterales bacterium]|nr:tail fiber domain-containing protein [Chthoniobacterales bacterium]
MSPPPDGGYPSLNTAEGEDALFSLTTGADNTAIGYHALYNIATSSFNTAIGALALAADTTGSQNTAIGTGALALNTTGLQNTAVGDAALSANTTGGLNTAVGYAMYSNTTGGLNTAAGAAALAANTTGGANVAIGNSALNKSITGGFNIAIGVGALQKSKGSNNVAIGYNAGSILRMGDHNIYLDSGAGDETGVIRIGTAAYHHETFIAGISGATVAGGVTVVVDANGQLGTLTSSGRYKDSIQPMDKASEAILSLKPVTFHYKKELDPKGIPQFGLVAEQVEKVNPDLVARDDQGKAYTVRYEAVNAMLLNEFLKEHGKVEALEHAQDASRADAAAQQREIDSLRAAVKEQAAQIQKVSDQFAASQTAPPMVVNNE